MNPIFEKLSLEEVLKYEYIGKKKSHHKFQLFYCFLKNHIDNPLLLKYLKELMNNQKIIDLSTLTHTDNKLNLLMYAPYKVGLFLIENNLIDLSSKDNLGNNFLYHASYDLLKNIDHNKYNLYWNDLNNEGDNIFSYSGKTGVIVVQKLKLCLKNGVNPNHKNNKENTIIDNILLSNNINKIKKIKEIIKIGCISYNIKNQHKIPEEIREEMQELFSAQEKIEIEKILNKNNIEEKNIKKRL